MNERTKRGREDPNRKKRGNPKKQDFSLQTPANDAEWEQELEQAKLDELAKAAQTGKVDAYVQTEKRKRKSTDSASKRDKRNIEPKPAPEPVPEPEPAPAPATESTTQSVLKPKLASKPKAEPSSSSLSDTLPRSRTSASDVYDREEALTTKVLKFFKKRPPKPLPANLSDESIDQAVSISKAQQPVISGDQDNEKISQANSSDRPTKSHNYYFDSDTLVFSSSTPLMFNSDSTALSFDHRLPGRSLIEGMAFLYMVRPPDGGFGWIIVLISFLTQIIVDGIVFSIGTLLPAMAAEFGATSSEIVLVASVQVGCYFLAGAMASAFISSYGFRPVAIVGALLSAVATLCGSFSPNVVVLIVCYSVIGGPCLSMVWASSQLIIGYYFEKYRPIANGFSCSGAGVGMIIFSISNVNLLHHIDWRQILHIYVVLLLIVALLVIFFFEVAPRAVGFIYKVDASIRSSSDEYYGDFAVHNLMRESSTHTQILEYFEHKKESKCRRCCNKIVQKLTPRCCHRKRKAASQKSDDSEKKYLVRQNIMQREDLFYTGPVEYDEPKSRERLDGQDVQLLGSVTEMQGTMYALHHQHVVGDQDNDSRRSLAQLKRDEEKHPYLRYISPRNWLHPKIKHAFNLLFDFRLFKRKDFQLLVLSAFLYPMGFNIPFIYAKSRTSIPVNFAMWIAPAIGFSNFVTRIACGFIAYRYKNRVPLICGGGLVFGGSLVFISAFFGTNLVWFQFVYAFCFGIAPAVYATLRGIIYVRYLGLHKLTNAFGITALAMGIGVFLGTTVAGFMVDLTGGYVLAFAFGGICIIMSGTVKLLLPVLIKQRNN